jgi:hypothetical protein
MSWYKTGTISIAANSTTVTGIGTQWTNSIYGIGAGQILLIPGSGDVQMFEIASVISNTQLTLVAGPTAAINNSGYAILSFYGGSYADFGRQLSAFLAEYQALLASWQTIMTGPGDVAITAPDGTVTTIHSFPALSAKLDGFGANSVPSFGSLELLAATPFIDFHYGSTSADYNMRIINDVSGKLDVMGGSLGVPGGFVAGAWGLQTKAGRNAGFGSTGFMAEWNASNQLWLWVDNTPIGQFTGAGSDRRIKEDIVYLTDTATDLQAVLAVQPVTYAFSQRGLLNKSGERRGFIAQDLLTTFPVSVLGTILPGEENKSAEDVTDFLSLDPLALCSVLAGAIKELSAKVDAQAQQIATLQAPVTPPAS